MDNGELKIDKEDLTAHTKFKRGKKMELSLLMMFAKDSACTSFANANSEIEYRFIFTDKNQAIARAYLTAAGYSVEDSYSILAEWQKEWEEKRNG